MWYHVFFASKVLHISLAPPDTIRAVTNIDADIQYNEEKKVITDEHTPVFLKIHKIHSIEVKRILNKLRGIRILVSACLS